jgi:hypothetical protein
MKDSRYQFATSVYNDLSANYGEVAEALLQMKYKNESDEHYFLFINEKYDAEVRLPARSPDSLFFKANLMAFSNIMFMKGIIKHPDDFAKRIEKNRLANAAQVAA